MAIYTNGQGLLYDSWFHAQMMRRRHQTKKSLRLNFLNNWLAAMWLKSARVLKLLAVVVRALNF